MNKKYKCKKCGHEVTLDMKADAPGCCGQPMEEARQIPVCRDAGPEASRPMSEEEPCNDFTGHQN